MSGRVGRTRMATVLALAVMSTIALAFTASASAREVHVFSKSFGKSELSLSAQSGIAVNQETGEVYVADTNHSRIAKFTATGTADGSLTGVTSPTFIAIDNSTGSAGDIYVVEGEGTVSKRDPSGALVTSWGAGGHMTTTEVILGIAVDPSGNLWLATEIPGVVGPLGPEFGLVGGKLSGKEIDPSGTTLRSWTVPFVEEEVAIFVHAAPAGVAVDSADNLYLYFESSQIGALSGIKKFDPTGNKLSQANPDNPKKGVAIEPGTDDVYGGNFEESPNLVRISPQLAEVERFGGSHEGTQGVSSVRDKLKSIASIAVATSGLVYAVDPVEGVVAVYGLEEVVPPTVTIEPTDTIGRTSAHVVGHIDPNAVTGSLPSHDVAWEFRCTPACPGHSGYIEVELDGSERTVEATIGNLEPGTEYSVRLVGENRGGKAEAGPEPFETEAAPPTVIDEAPSEVFLGEATLNAGINSNGAETTYHFEYMTAAAFQAAHGFEGALSTPESGPLPAPAEVRPVSFRVAGLEPGTKYVYRAVAHNSLGTENGTPVEFLSQTGSNPLEANCPNQAFRTDAGSRLPDCRAYEMVSPVEKGGADVEAYGTGLQAALDGSGVTWYTGQTATGIPLPGGAHQGYAFYLSSLSGESWNSQRLLAPEQLGTQSFLVGLTGDEHYALIETASGNFRDPALYLLDTAARALTPIVAPQVGQAVGSRVFALDGASADDSLIFFESRLQLTSSAAVEKNNLYVWNRETGSLSLAGVLPGAKGEAPPGGSFGGAYSWWGTQPNLDTGGAEEALYVEAVHAISESGDAVYFTAGHTGQLYLRRGLTTTKPSTVRVSVANPGVSDPLGPKPAAFQEATPDGGKAFFLSSEKLTQNANTGPTDEGSDLYRYDASAKPPLVDVTPLPEGAGARVQGVLGVSENGRSGYLVAKGVLASGGVDGESNVYHFQEEGGAFSYTFVADQGPTPRNLEQRNWSPTANQQKTARVSKDGGTVLFMSERALTGVPGTCISTECLQLYRYSMDEGHLACLSCNPTGEPSPSGAELSLGLSGTLVVPDNRIRTETESGNAISGVLPQNLSASGTRVFFQTSAPLLPEDVNGAGPAANCNTRRTCVDVYEWEAPDPSDPTDTCHSTAQNGGCLYLLSTGESGRSSYFVNASADGSSAFIITSSALVPADRDELADVYDARVDGGLVGQHATATEPCNSSDTCKETGSVPPSPASAGTSFFQGPGNPKPKKCKQGMVQKHGKCVKKHHKKKHHKKKHHKKKDRTAGTKRSGGAK